MDQKFRLLPAVLLYFALISIPDALASNHTNASYIENRTNESQTNVSIFYSNFSEARDRNPEERQEDIFSNIISGIADIANEGVSGTTALLLIIGGLLILFVIVPLSMINSMFWKRSHMTHEDKRSSNMYRMGLYAGKSVESDHADDIIDALKDIEDVHVRLVNSTATYKTIRLNGCNSCRNKKSNRPICAFEQGFLEGAFGRLRRGVSVTETECRAKTGKSYCEFDIRHRR